MYVVALMATATLGRRILGLDALLVTRGTDQALVLPR